jgi:hypothetical protein
MLAKYDVPFNPASFQFIVCPSVGFKIDLAE